jgi:CBS domain containing-hemolysin-like protein
VNILSLVAAAMLVAVNGYFVALEFALVASQRAKLELLVPDGSRRGDIALAAMRDLSRQLAASQLGVTMASLGLGVLGEPAVARLLEPVLDLAGDPPAGLVHGISLVLALGIVVFFHMVLG